MTTIRVGVAAECIAALSPLARRLHQTILHHFAISGRPPLMAALNTDKPLRELHDRDVIQLDDTGEILAAYPFSAIPTPHTVAIADGPTVYAMCAIDALGIAAMLGRDITVHSVDPQSGDSITVIIRGGQAEWIPEDAVVLVGSTAPADEDCCHVPAAQICCGVINFFAGTRTASAWLKRHVSVRAVIVDPVKALQMGKDLFGPLLSDSESGAPIRHRPAVAR
ncbi:hypothetical protein Rhe02_15520 [Rhizocola hellebori]|uniref:Alkylmercury lyase n=1 Tax=Rhizocola hellebori TaxID=1392758 RepID=A0A8J3Q5B1_9ACTN|nr:hypothetical protein Rhe02_15520 [Rhizocola hellebori]